MAIKSETAAKPKTARLEARIPSDLKTLVQRAAALQGQTLTDFVLAAAVETARRVLRESEVLTLSERDQTKLAEAILNPPAPASRLADVARSRREHGR